MASSGRTMLCPVCQTDLHMTERQGVEIDYCPKCRGVWLDRGELDKIIERSAQEVASARAPPPVAGPAAGPAPAAPYASHPAGQERRHDEYDRHGKRKKRSFFEELFD